MNRETQRTFVLLRQLGGGRESGYARAETREGGVKLNLVVQGFGRSAAPYAFALTPEGLRPLGALRMDARGQGGVVATMAPADFRQAQMLLVADGDPARIPLAGTVGRGGWIDWAQVRAAIADFLHPSPPEPAQPEPTQPEPAEPEPAEPEPAEPTESEPAQPEEPETAAAEQEKEPDQPETAAQAAEDADMGEMEGAQPAPAPEREVPEQAAQPGPSAFAEAAAPPETEADDIYDLPAEPEVPGTPEVPETPDLPAAPDLPAEAPAEEARHELPEALRAAYWPQALWPLHDLFERFEAVEPFPGRQGEVYIRVPLGDAYEEIDHYLIGAKVEDGWVTGVGYLLPGPAAEAPPPGMAGYVLQDGYWQSWQYAEPDAPQGGD